MTVLLFIFLYLAIAVGVGSLWSSALDRSAAIRDGKVDSGDRVMSCLAPMLWPFTGAPALVYVINTHMRARAAETNIKQKAIQAYKDNMESKAKVLEKEIFNEFEESKPQRRVPPKSEYLYPKPGAPYTKKGGVYGAEADRVGRKNMEDKRGF
jgi:hypothetical protein